MRRYLLVTAGFSIATGVLVVTQASVLAEILSRAATGRAGPAALLVPLAMAAGVVVLRAGQRYAQEVAAARAAATVKSTLRAEVLARTSDAGPVAMAGRRRGELATLVTRGLDALDPYLTGYLPQLFTAVAVPVAVLARLAFADLASALVIGATLPLIPVFAILVGAHTRSRTERQWRILSRLGGHFLDVVAGLPTLRVFGRAHAQVAEVRRVADTYRGATMRTLRVAFLSALVLELVATLSVALVAVPVGLRLLQGGMTLATALLVLLLAPEAYAPRGPPSTPASRVSPWPGRRSTFRRYDSRPGPGSGCLTCGGRRSGSTV